jgi:hypothetical protein
MLRDQKALEGGYCLCDSPRQVVIEALDKIRGAGG